ncbi:MAG TPA: hypothetical protein PKN48_08385 [Bacteroidales bacterium]|nr:hypothetical protein [Bacteroidales bacterium]
MRNIEFWQTILGTIVSLLGAYIAFSNRKHIRFIQMSVMLISLLSFCILLSLFINQRYKIYEIKKEIIYCITKEKNIPYQPKTSDEITNFIRSEGLDESLIPNAITELMKDKIIVRDPIVLNDNVNSIRNYSCYIYSYNPQ